jgi:hypothetical protein
MKLNACILFLAHMVYLQPKHILSFISCIHTVIIQGGALNRGLLFADPPPSLLGAVSGNIREIR